MLCGRQKNVVPCGTLRKLEENAFMPSVVFKCSRDAYFEEKSKCVMCYYMNGPSFLV